MAEWEWLVHLAVGTLIPAAGGYLWGKYRDYKADKELQKEEYSLMKKGLQSVLRQLMLQSYHTYQQAGYASEDSKAAFNAMHISYAGLGKNGVMDHICDAVMALPETPPNV